MIVNNYQKSISLPSSWIIALILALCLPFIGGCTPGQENPATVANLAPAWSSELIVTQAYQNYAPALGSTPDGWVAVWVQGNQLAFRTIAADGTLGAIITLPPVRQPWQPVLIPGTAGEWHLLWFDLDRYDEPRLYAALLQADGTLLRGPITVTPEPASAAAIAPGDHGTVIIIWADTNAVPTLYGQRLDTQGRPNSGPPAIVAHNAENPMLNRLTDGTWVLGWLAFPDSPGQPSHSRTPTVSYAGGSLPWEQLLLTTTLGSVTLPPLTEYIEHTALGVDQTNGYFFISTRSAETGQAQSSVLTFPLAESNPTISTIENLSLPATPPDTPASVATGFNTGLALPANNPPLFAVGWPIPLYGQTSVLPVAFNMTGQLVIGYLSAGEITGYQPLVTTNPILGAPGLWADRSRHLTVAGTTYPDATNAPANLLLSSTNPEFRDAQTP
ncbi:hypothetical protein ACFLYO_02460 [Chloroflexota bacterium]